MFYLTTHSTHFIYGYMTSDIWLRTILIVRKETRCHHIGYSYRLTARVLLYAPSHRQDNTYHGLCYTSHGALAGTRNRKTKNCLFNHTLNTFQLDLYVRHVINTEETYYSQHIFINSCMICRIMFRRGYPIEINKKTLKMVKL